MPYIELFISLSRTADIAAAPSVRHHSNVSYIAYSIGKMLNFKSMDLNNLLLAGALHDIGMLFVRKADAASGSNDVSNHHAEYGYILLKSCENLQYIGKIIRYHHTPYNYGNTLGFKGEEIPLESNILNIAETLEGFVCSLASNTLEVTDIYKKILNDNGKNYNSDVSNALLTILENRDFWTNYGKPFENLIDQEDFNSVFVPNEKNTNQLLELCSKAVDFRSPYTATHSSDVAAAAEALASLCSLSPIEILQIKAAGFLHDLGKVSVPIEYIEKEAPLSKNEFGVVKRHTNITDMILKPLEEYDSIKQSGILHHERLDGSGYPYHLKNSSIPVGARIMAVADVYSALTENRPYRSSIDMFDIKNIMCEMGYYSGLDIEIVLTLIKYNSYINAIRLERQNKLLEEYNLFKTSVFKTMKLMPGI